MLACRSAAPSSLSEKAVAEMVLIVPEFNKANMPSWMTSVYAVSGWNGPSSSPRRTALAMLPTPDCRGRRDAGRRPPFTSYARNSKRFSAILCDMTSTGLNAVLRSGEFVSTTATIFSGGQ